MKYGSKEHDYLKRLLVINPKITVGQATRRLKSLNDFIDTKRGQHE